MPIDQKKINGPESSFSYKQFLKTTDANQATAEVIKRADGRNANESRELAIQLSAISKAKGSCYIECGNTKVIVGVFELREISRQNKYIDKGQLYCDFKYSPFSRETRKSVGENEEKLMASSVKTALESTVCLHEFPNYQIDVFILVLEDDGSVLSSAIVAAGLAFVDASFPVYDLISSTTVALKNGLLLVDPTSSEEEDVNNNNTLQNHGTIIVSSLKSMDQVSQILFNGFLDVNLINEAKKAILELNKSQTKYLKKVISSKMSKEFIET